MGDMLSQEEIDALLSGNSISEADNSSQDAGNDLSPQEIDALGEIGNISMGTSATTLFTLLGHKVSITTPSVTVSTWEELSKIYNEPYVAVKVEYTMGLVGTNLLILNENDTKIITDLMMGGDGANTSGELTDLHLSAISEAMNQMIGSSATSMASMFEKKIDISPPKAFMMQFDSNQPYSEFEGSQKLVKIAFKMVVGDLIDSEIMQIIPVSFAKSMVENLLNADISGSQNQSPVKDNIPQPPSQNMRTQPEPQPQMGYQPPQTAMQSQGNMFGGGYDQIPNEQQRSRSPVNVQPAQFQSFDDGRITIEKKNISLIMDVPLQVTVELGRTQRLIRDILEFGPGSIIELDKLAGEPVDILVNGKVIAKGEVVVIDESFGVRIIDIIHPSKRL